MTWVEALILGVIQGLTEFLPVSSSGHLELASAFLNTQNKENLLFTVIVHAATSLATLVIFRKDILEIAKDVFKFKWNKSTKFFCYILISAIPVFFVGFFLKDYVEEFFIGNIFWISIMLCLTGLLLWISSKQRNENKDVSGVSAFIIGIAQAIAVIPGISRSGATIAIALLLKIEKNKAARFSFLMVIFPIFGATTLEILEYTKDSSTHSLTFESLLIGFLAAFFSGWLACRWMIQLVRNSNLNYFALYCLMMGLFTLVVL